MFMSSMYRLYTGWFGNCQQVCTQSKSETHGVIKRNCQVQSTLQVHPATPGAARVDRYRSVATCEPIT